MKSQDQVLLEQAYNKILKEDDQFDPRLNVADLSNRRVDITQKQEQDYEAADKKEFQSFKERERNAGLGPDDRAVKPSKLDYAFKNDIIEVIKLGKPTKVLWVFSGPKPGEYKGERKWKDISSLVNASEKLEGQEFQGKFNKFKIVRIEPSEHRIRHEQYPKASLGAFYKAIPAK